MLGGATEPVLDGRAGLAVVGGPGPLPRGLSGRLYWWALVPAHHLIFDAMASRIVATAEGAQR